MSCILRSITAPRERLLELRARWPERYPALLESAARSEALGRYDILFAFPEERLSAESPGTFLKRFEEWSRRSVA
ncbi:MAG TPA: hypothetical protein VH542_03520, partial [Steroidobacteraceae bacterium]